MTRKQATVLHVDLDAFYVSMELLRHPDLRGTPVIVGGLGQRGVVSTCSYEARAYGVRSAMPTARARQLCPHATYLHPDFAYYGPASKQFHAILRDYTPLVEPAGADESYMDVAGSNLLFGDAETIAKDIRRRVREEIGITTSVGLSVNKLVSKVASDAGKPDGLVVVPAGAEAAFLAPRPIRDLPMVGPKTAGALASMGVHTIGDLAALPVAALEAKFHRHGRELRDRALGIYDAPVHSDHGAAKSISRETTFGEDEPSGDRLRAVLRGQAERVAADLGRQARSARTVTLKLRFPPFETLTRSSTANGTLELADEIYDAAVALLVRAWGENGYRPVRLIGVGVTNLQERARQLRLGESLERDHLAETVSGLRDRFGDGVIRRASEVRRRDSGSPRP
jgi:DNA polymerase-4